MAGTSASAAPLRRACIFDFDETLAVSTGSPRANPVSLFGGVGRLAELRTLLDDLTSAGIALGICSYNGKAIIVPLLEAAGLLQFFRPSLIFGYEVFERDGALHGYRNRSGADKGTVFKTLVEPALLAADAESETPLAGFAPPPHHELRVPSNGTIDESIDGRSAFLFCDDDPKNIHDVRTACLCCATLYVARRRGLEPSHFEAVRAWAQLPPATAPPPMHTAAALDVAEQHKEQLSSPKPPPLRSKTVTRDLSDSAV